MRILFIIYFLITILNLSSSAQDICGTGIPSSNWEKLFSKQVQQFKITKERNRNLIDYTIPVIVHILHNGDNEGVNENISLAQVQSQITILNNDYAGTNSDINNAPSVFAAVKSGNTGIQFCLAKIYVDGSALSEEGIERINWQARGWTNPNFFSNNDDLAAYFNDVIKPNSIWDPTKYLNIWLAEWDIGLLGYATFPALSGLSGITSGIETASTSGIVIRTSAWGNTGTANMAHYNKGRVATHEVGHWLGLRHIWGDLDNCGGSDYCEDTPPQYGGSINPVGCNTGCPVFPLHAGLCTRPDGPGNTNITNINGDMFMNYMDYTYDECKFMFSSDQASRMQTAMENGIYRKYFSPITCQLPPDLIIINPQAAPLTVSAGNSITISFAEDNIGSINAPPNYVSFHLSVDDALTPDQNGDIYLDEYFVNQTIPAFTQTISLNKQIVIPSNTPSGTYYLFFSADGSLIIDEGDEENNFATVQINVVGILGCQPPVLSIPLIEFVVAPASASFHISASGNDNLFQWQINTGSAWTNLANNSTYSGVYTTTLNISSTNVGMSGYQYRCKVTNPCSSVPSEGASLFVTTSVTLCDNDYACAPKPISITSSCIFTSCTTIGATPPSPGVSFTSCSGVPYQTGRYDDDVWFSIVATSTNPITIKAIPTSNLPNFDIVLGVYTGNCLSLSQTGCADNNPSGYAEDLVFNPVIGTTYLVRVFGYGIGSAYSGDFDICITSPGQSNPITDPDLVISSVDLSSNNICEQGSLTISYEIENTGGSSASSSTAKYYLSSNTSYSASDVLLGSSSIGSISSNGSISKAKTLNIPAGTNTGSWYILIIADADDDVDEGASGESNNIDAESISVDVCAPADIVLTYIGVPPFSGNIDTYIPVSFDCTNNGSSTSPAARMGFYVSTDNIFDASDVYIDDEHFSSLSPGETDHESAGFRIPECFACGNYYVIMVADYQNIVSESDKTNNVYAFPFEIIGCVSCSIGISSGGASYQSGGGSGNITITADECCEWNASTNDPWITIINNAGFGNGTINYNVSSCTGGVTRNGSIIVSGQSFPITQTCIESCNNSQSFEWAVQAGSSTLSDAGVDVVIDANENLYMTGDIQGAANFGNGIILTTPTTAPDIFVSKHNNTGQIQWAFRFGSNEGEAGNGIAIDNNGDIYVIGSIESSVTFGTTTISGNGTNNGAAFLLKLNSNGDVQWAQKINATDHASPNDIMIDKANDIIVITGYYSTGASDGLFITKYNTSGSQLWLRTYALDNNIKNAYGITVDNAGNIIMCGRYRETVTIDGITLVSPVLHDMNGFICKLDMNGNAQWARQLSSPEIGTDELESVVVDAANNIYTIGNVDSNAIVDNIVIPLSNTGKMIMIKYDPNGNPIWAKASVTGSQGNNQRLIKGNNNDIYLCGAFIQSIQLDSLSVTSNGNYDAFLSHVEEDGKIDWIKTFGGTQDDATLGIVINGTEDLFISGRFRGTASYGNSTITSAGSDDIFLAKFKQCDLPAADITSNGISILCNGETNMLSTSFCSSYTYQWYLNESEINNANNATYTASQTGVYKVKVTAFAGCESFSSPISLQAQNSYTFNGNGNWNDAANWLNGLMPPSTITGCSEIIIDPLATGECVLNILQTVSAGAKITIRNGKSFRIENDLLIQN